MKRNGTSIIYSPSDLVRYFASPFASWMDRYHVERPGHFLPDEETEDQRLIAETGNQHERNVLAELKAEVPGLHEVCNKDFAAAREETLAALASKAPIVFQAALDHDGFAGYADFVRLRPDGSYQIWDTKLARSPKPYYAIQLCCYSEMLAAVTGAPLPEQFGIILGSNEQVEFRSEDFIHFYRRLKASFRAMQNGFSGELSQRPEPLPRADHGRWSSHAEAFFLETDHLVQVAGISVGQIKKLRKAGITTMTQLGQAGGVQVPRLANETLERLVAQARLQNETRADRANAPDEPPRFEILPQAGPNGEPVGLACLPLPHPADVYFDMEGYPLVADGLEYLFGACYREGGSLAFVDWWAHDREQEKAAIAAFVDWIYDRWMNNPGMHIYHYAAYEVSAVHRLRKRHDTRHEEVDQLLRNNVFVDLYQIVRRGLRIGEDSYSIKKVEHLYRGKRVTGVATAVDSIVQYARWMESGQSMDWRHSDILKGIRDYNEDDCKSTAKLVDWLQTLITIHPITGQRVEVSTETRAAAALTPEVLARLETIADLRESNDPVATVLADLMEFHRREQKPVWWRMFDRAASLPEQLHDDPGCIEGVKAHGSPQPDKKSLLQAYRFDPRQECKLQATDRSQVKFTHNLQLNFNLVSLNLQKGHLVLRVSQKALNEKSGGQFPQLGSLIPDEVVPSAGIPQALAEVAAGQLTDTLHPSVWALLNRVPPSTTMVIPGESTMEAAIRIARDLAGGCLVIQGPPGTGKTYTASRVIQSLLAEGNRVGISSNSHKAVLNLLQACGEALESSGSPLKGIKVGGDAESRIFADYPGLEFVAQNADAHSYFAGGVVGGTAWLFTRPEWEGELDYLFIDEAGQVPLANAVAMERSAANLILLGDQMQLEQPIHGYHPGEAGLSVLQYALMDSSASKLDAPVFHAVVPSELGLFLGESRRMHPDICQFVSESSYDGRLVANPDCSRQKISLPPSGGHLVKKEHGIIFSPVEHEGNTQQSDEEVGRVKSVFDELLGCDYTDKHGETKRLELDDFLFIAPYNAQVRALQEILPNGARVGSVDKFQGQEAPVCIFSLCSSFGEYGSRGLGFILDRNRVNVAISRAKCLAVVVADPRIAHSPANSIAEMRLLNLFCKLTE